VSECRERTQYAVLDYFTHKNAVHNQSGIIANKHGCDKQFRLIDEVTNDIRGKDALLFIELDFKLVGRDEGDFHPAGESRGNER
jgi:hypothetical protein